MDNKLNKKSEAINLDILNKLEINLIYACSQNGVIGKDNKLPWNLPEDLKHFKDLTLNYPIIMGRKTWESLPIKPLEKRINIILSKNQLNLVKFIDSYWFNNLNDALIKSSKYNNKVWIIGGANLFKQTLNLASNIFMTLIQKDFIGDSFISKLDNNIWQERKHETNISKGGLKFSFINYKKL